MKKITKQKYLAALETVREYREQERAAIDLTLDDIKDKEKCVVVVEKVTPEWFIDAEDGCEEIEGRLDDLGYGCHYAHFYMGSLIVGFLRDNNMDKKRAALLNILKDLKKL